MSLEIRKIPNWGSICHSGIAQGFQTEAILSSEATILKITNTGNALQKEIKSHFLQRNHMLGDYFASF